MKSRLQVTITDFIIQNNYLYTIVSERKRRTPTKTGPSSPHPAKGEPVSIAG